MWNELGFMCHSHPYESQVASRGASRQNCTCTPEKSDVTCRHVESLMRECSILQDLLTSFSGTELPRLCCAIKEHSLNIWY